ncbi:hypothetical protein HDU79_011336, partial [Rhizoclosmatium sp. JEL0117]
MALFAAYESLRLAVSSESMAAAAAVEPESESESTDSKRLQRRAALNSLDDTLVSSAAIDAADEFSRREKWRKLKHSKFAAKLVPAKLEVVKEYSFKRNDQRAKLAALSDMDFALLCFDTLDEVEARLTDDDIDRYNLKHGLIAPSSSPLPVGAPPPPSSPLPQEPTATKNNNNYTSPVPTATNSSSPLPTVAIHHPASPSPSPSPPPPSSSSAIPKDTLSSSSDTVLPSSSATITVLESVEVAHGEENVIAAVKEEVVVDETAKSEELLENGLENGLESEETREIEATKDLSDVLVNEEKKESLTEVSTEVPTEEVVLETVQEVTGDSKTQDQEAQAQQQQQQENQNQMMDEVWEMVRELEQKNQELESTAFALQIENSRHLQTINDMSKMW